MEKLSNLLDELSQITFTHTLGRPQRAKENALKLNYEDKYKVISYDVIFECDYNDEFLVVATKDIYRSDEFIKLIDKYKD